MKDNLPPQHVKNICITQPPEPDLTRKPLALCIIGAQLSGLRTETRRTETELSATAAARFLCVHVCVCVCVFETQRKSTERGEEKVECDKNKERFW